LAPVSAEQVRLEHVSCGYGGPPVVEAVDLVLREGEFVGLVGPSAAGKTTVLRAVTGAIAPVHGRVWRRPGLRFGYVPQLTSIDWNFPVTVGEVAAMGLAQAGWGPRLGLAGRRMVASILDELGLGGVARRHIRELSGGQQQRVFLARALVGRPDVVLLDEPTAGLDVQTRHEILHLLAGLHRRGTTVLLTTHDLNGLAAHLPRAVCVNRTIVADGRPGEVLHPYVLERTFGAPMAVLRHGGMPVIVEHHDVHPLTGLDSA
jgi:ABC-type Mn2+/Zn2+ transport system ATPase subunit